MRERLGRKVGLGGPRRRRTGGREAEVGWKKGKRKEEQAPAICRHVVNFRYLPCVVTGDFVFSATSKKEKRRLLWSLS